MHIEVDKMGEKVSNGQKSRLAASECTVAVLKALSVLEGGYQLPQAGDSSALSLLPTSTVLAPVFLVKCEVTVDFVSIHVLIEQMVYCDQGSSIPHCICICAL